MNLPNQQGPGQPIAEQIESLFAQPPPYQLVHFAFAIKNKGQNQASTFHTGPTPDKVWDLYFVAVVFSDATANQVVGLSARLAGTRTQGAGDPGTTPAPLNDPANLLLGVGISRVVTAGQDVFTPAPFLQPIRLFGEKQDQVQATCVNPNSNSGNFELHCYVREYNQGSEPYEPTL